jgi:hypothetical protein
MAYKFSVGTYRHSGSMVAEEGITVDSGGLTVTGSVSLPAGEINTAELADAAVTTIKIADLNVTVGKLAADAVETAKIKDLAVTNDKLAGSIASTKIAELNAFDTADLAENATNKYFTDARARAAVSVNDVSGDGSLTYDSGSGVITYTGPSASEVRAHLSAGDGLSFASGQFAVTSSIAGAGLAWSSGVLSVDTAEIAAGLSGSIRDVVADFVEGSDFVTFDDANGTIGVSAAAFTGSARSVVSVTDNGGDGSLSYNASTGVISYTGPSAAEARAHFSAVDAGGDGSFSYADGVFTYTGPSSAEARAHFSAVDAGGDGSFAYDSATGVFTYTGPSSTEVRAHLTAGDGLAYSGGQFALTASVAGAGLGYSAGVLDVLPTGAMAIKNDRVALSSSIAGAGMAAIADGVGAVSQLAIAAGGVTNNMLSGAIANGKLANSTVAVVAGQALTGGGTVALGSSITLDVAVNGDALEISADQVALKSTISGARTFANDVTISGNLTVNGTTTYINTTDLVVSDALIKIASGSAAFAANQGIQLGDYAELKTAAAVADVGNALSSSLPLVAPSMKAGTFYGNLEGAMLLGMETKAADATISKNITRASANITLTLPSAPVTGQEHRIKCVGAANSVIVAAQVGGTIDGADSIVLESPSAAVSLVWDGSAWMVF